MTSKETALREPGNDHDADNDYDDADDYAADTDVFAQRAVHELRGVVNSLVLSVGVLDVEGGNPDGIKAALTVIREGVAELAMVVGKLEKQAKRLER